MGIRGVRGISKGSLISLCNNLLKFIVSRAKLGSEIERDAIVLGWGIIILFKLLKKVEILLLLYTAGGKKRELGRIWLKRQVYY